MLGGIPGRESPVSYGGVNHGWNPGNGAGCLRHGRSDFLRQNPEAK